MIEIGGERTPFEEIELVGRIKRSGMENLEEERM